MPAAWKTVRVFISSTFRDMHAERDHLVRVVFPELRERCAQRHLHLIDVDLRWGVTEEDARRGKALEICLREIEDSRPFFVGLLGERYGWIPPRYDVPDDERFDYLRDIEPGHSITAMEIYQGVLKNPQLRSHAFFYFRDPAFIDTLPPQSQPDFRAEDEHHGEKLRILKAEIRAAGLPVRENYRHDDLDSWGRQVFNDLWGAIKAEHPDPATLSEPDPLDAERAYHDFFIETRTGLFIGQRHLLARLHAFGCGHSPGPMVVTGTPGCGKSSLLARFISQFRRLEPDTFMLFHFIGASPSSTDPRQMLRRLCQELARRFGFGDEVPEDWNELRVCFRQFLERASEAGRMVLVIDALNQLDATYHAHDLDWLPALFSPGLRLIVSGLEGAALDSARLKYVRRRDMIVTSLRLVDQGFIIARQLQRARKRLTTVRKYRQWRAFQVARGEQVPPEQDRSQLRYILTGVYSRKQTPAVEHADQRETANPLYLTLVVEELRLFGDYDRLPEFISRLPIDIPAMFHAVLDRLEGDHGRELVEHSLSLIAIGRHGLLETELLELLARPEEGRFPMALWSRLYRGLAAYVKPRASTGGGEDGLIDFFHQQLAKAVRGRYLGTEAIRVCRHAALANYFHRKGDPADDDGWKGNYPRSLSELVHHKIAGQVWAGLEKTLTTLRFLEANVASGRAFALVTDFTAALAKLPADRPQQRVVRLLAEALRRDVHFIARHSQDYPQGLFQCLWNTCWWHDCGAGAEHYSPSPTSVEPWAAGAGAGRVSRTHVPSSRPATEGLSRLLECWRRRKEEDEPGVPWLRAVRPPPIRLASGQRAVMCGHAGTVWSVDFSPDGRRIASGSADGTVRVWDAESGAELAVLRGHEGVVASVSYGPDGRRVVSISTDKTIRVWDVESGALLTVLREHQNGGADSVHWNPDGRRIASGSEDGTVRVWDSESGAQVTVFRGHQGRVKAVRWNSDGSRIASGSDDNTVRVWDVEDGMTLHILRGHGKAVSGVDYSSSGARIVSASHDMTVRTWDASSGAELSNDRLPSTVTSVAFSPVEEQIIAGSDNGWAWMWDADKGWRVAANVGNDNTIHSVAWAPCGNQFVTGGVDHIVRVWDARVEAQSDELQKHAGTVTSLFFSSDGELVVSHSPGAMEVREWDAHSGHCVRVIEPVTQWRDTPDCSSEFPLRLVARGLECVLEHVDDGRAVAWFPVNLTGIRRRPSHRTWAGAAADHMYLITLEGGLAGPDQSADGPRQPPL